MTNFEISATLQRTRPGARAKTLNDWHLTLGEALMAFERKPGLKKHEYSILAGGRAYPEVECLSLLKLPTFTKYKQSHTGGKALP